MQPSREERLNPQTAIACPTFRAAGITAYLQNDDRLEVAR
jgi:hypothetical protein